MFWDLIFYQLPGIKEKNAKLDSSLEQISTLTSVDQPKAISDLNSSAKQLTIAKEEYNDKVIYSSQDDIVEAGITRPYETEYLQTIIGNHAKNKGINLRYELKQSSNGISGEYDMFFTITGSYVSISEFITAIENDSSLNFRIEGFKLIPSSGTETLQATFSVKSINVKIEGTNQNTNNNQNNMNDYNNKNEQ